MPRITQSSVVRPAPQYLADRHTEGWRSKCVIPESDFVRWRQYIAVTACYELCQLFLGFGTDVAPRTTWMSEDRCAKRRKTAENGGVLLTSTFGSF